MNTDFEKEGAKAPCLLCGRSASKHSLDTADICNCYIGPQPELVATLRRCGICGFIVDMKYEATKPTVEYGSAGRAKTKLTQKQIPDRLITALAVETVGWAILQALHEGVEDGPQSWSDMASDQEKRIKKAAIAAIEAIHGVLLK